MNGNTCKQSLGISSLPVLFIIFAALLSFSSIAYVSSHRSLGSISCASVYVFLSSSNYIEYFMIWLALLLCISIP